MELGTMSGARCLHTFAQACWLEKDLFQIDGIDQVIQAVTFLSLSWRSRFTFEKVTFSPSQKGHDRRIARDRTIYMYVGHCFQTPSKIIQETVVNTQDHLSFFKMSRLPQPWVYIQISAKSPPATWHLQKWMKWPKKHPNNHSEPIK